MALTHIRIIFPLALDYRNLIKTFWDNETGELMGAVLHYNMYWKDDVLTPAYEDGMEVLVGVERPAATDFFGTVQPVPARGLLRGEFVRWERLQVAPKEGTRGIGWIVFRLRYDMQEGPETWNENWTQVLTTMDNAPAFYYALERKDDT